MKRSKRHRSGRRHAPWTPFERMPAVVPDHPALAGMTADEYERVAGVCYLNSRYQVHVVESAPNALGVEGFTWLSIKNLDKDARHDWREFQRIKNELCGEEREGVELYPAESRLHDTADQFHMWVLPAGATWPFGYTGRFVSDAHNPGGSQRPFEVRPADCLGAGEERDAELLDGRIIMIGSPQGSTVGGDDDA